LTEANLIGVGLPAADMKGVDLWRAILARNIISSESLHQALGYWAPGSAEGKSG
jgi:hypothetical protein